MSATECISTAHHRIALSALDIAGWLEVHSFPSDRYTLRPLVIEEHRAVAPCVPGIGVEFEWQSPRPWRT